MSKQDVPEWLSEEANADVGGGNFIPSADGLIVIFKIIDLNEKPIEVKKTYEGKDAGIKKQWKVIPSELKFLKDAYHEILSDKKPDKLEKIEKFEVGHESILELSRTASKSLANFIIDEKITEDDEIKYLRLGDSFDTEYKFKKNK